MNNAAHHTAAVIVPVDPAVAATDPFADARQVTGWHALVGLSIGVLRGLAPGTDVAVRITGIVEAADDLAVADRVAWVLAGRTGRQHVVLAASSGYLVATLDPELDWAASMRLAPVDHAPRIVSVANAEGVLPVLLPVAG